MTEPSKNKINCTLSLLLACCLSACNSSDTTEITDTTESTEVESPVLQTISGTTADGYLVNAQVCLDLNSNATCDADEPVAISTDGGEFIIEDISQDVDISSARVIVEVIANQTIDEDNPDQVIENGYTLTAPAGQTAFISPITTIVDAVMKNDEQLTNEEAERLVKDNLGIADDSDIDLFADYVAASHEESSETNEDYARLHIVAQVVTNAFAENMSMMEDDSQSLVDEDNFKATHNAVISHINDNLEDLVGVIDSVIAATEEGEDVSETVLASDVILFIAEEIQLAVEDIEEKIEEITEIRHAEPSNIETVLTEQQGLFFLDADVEHQVDSELCLITTDYRYEQFSMVEGLGQLNSWYFDFDNQTFERADYDEFGEEHFYQLTDQGWTLTEEATPEVISFSDDGNTVNMQFPGQGQRSVVAKSVDLSDKELASVERIDEHWAAQMSESTRFASESKMYALKMEQQEDSYVVPVFSCSDASLANNENCNNLWLTNNESSATDIDARATDLSSLINTTWNGEDTSELVMFHSMFNHGLTMALIEEEIQTETSTETKRYSLFFERNADCEGYQENDAGELVTCQPYFQVAEAQWHHDVIKGQPLIFLSAPLGIETDHDDDFNGLFLTVADEFVRVGLYLSQGHIWLEELALNQVAMESVTAGFETPESFIEDRIEACGVYHSENEEDDEETSTPEEEVPAPELISDAANTELLTGTVYIANHEDVNDDTSSETIMLQFTDNAHVTVFINETHWNDDTQQPYQEQSRQLGEWIVDANNQLLVYLFEEQTSSDGQLSTSIDWHLFTIEGDIDHTLTLIEQSDNGLIETFYFEQFDGLNIASNAVEGVITLVLETDDENCSLVVYVNDVTSENGSGYIDATACTEIAEEEGSQFEFTWQYGYLGQLMLTTIRPTGEEGHQVDLYQNADGMVYTLSHNEQSNEDEAAVSHLEAWWLSVN